jgi:hypothetical protein
MPVDVVIVRKLYVSSPLSISELAYLFQTLYDSVTVDGVTCPYGNTLPVMKPTVLTTAYHSLMWHSTHYRIRVRGYPYA